MNILALQTATKTPSIALKTKENTRVKFFEAKTIASVLVAEISNLLKEANLTYQDLNLIAINVGPGGFTSIRSSITFAKTAKLALGIDVFTCKTSDLEIFPQANAEHVATLAAQNHNKNNQPQLQAIYSSEPSINIK